MAKIHDSLKMSDSEIAELLKTESRLRIATIGPGADINLTPMTYGCAGGQIFIFGRGQKVVNIRRDSTATVLVDTGHQWRELQGVMLRGQARILESEAEELAEPNLADAQLNIGEKHGLSEDGKTIPYRASASGNTRRWIVFEPETIVSWDNSKL